VSRNEFHTNEIEALPIHQRLDAGSVAEPFDWSAKLCLWHGYVVGRLTRCGVPSIKLFKSELPFPRLQQSRDRGGHIMRLAGWWRSGAALRIRCWFLYGWRRLRCRHRSLVGAVGAEHHQAACESVAVPATPDHIALAEELGYETAWVYDTPALQLDCWMTLAVAATRTRHIRLGPGVMIPSLPITKPSTDFASLLRIRSLMLPIFALSGA
jgi:Luciferase-like monooxygenase